jgi:predicted transcriptional regulator
MAIPSEVYTLLREFDKEYGDHWKRIPETDERLLKVRLLLTPKPDTKRSNRTNRGNQKIVWTEEMDNYLTENDGKTLAELSRILDVSATAISKRRNRLGIKNVSQTEANGGIIYTDADGNEHVYASVTLARIATRLPRRIIYKALKIGKEWRYA